MVDVKTAFVHGDMDVELYIKLPEGLELFYSKINKETDCLVLDKTLYGTIQVNRRWWKKFVDTLEQDLHFKRSKADPCLLMKTDHNETVILCPYVNDGGLYGNKAVIEAIKTELEKKFNIKKVGEIHEDVGVM